jgi:hypothetical protein
MTSGGSPVPTAELQLGENGGIERIAGQPIAIDDRPELLEPPGGTIPFGYRDRAIEGDNR